MVVTALWTVLCTAGIAFYLRFFVALSKECKPRLTGHWVRVRLGSGEHASAEPQERKRPAIHAA